MTTQLTPTEMHRLADHLGQIAIDQAMAAAGEPSHCCGEHAQPDCLDSTAEQVALSLALQARSRRAPKQQAIPLDDGQDLDDPQCVTPPPEGR